MRQVGWKLSEVLTHHQMFGDADYIKASLALGEGQPSGRSILCITVVVTDWDAGGIA